MVTARIGSRATALVAALLVMIGASIIADRMGAPASWVALALVVFACGAVILAGVTTRTIRLSTYRAAAHRLGRLRGGSYALLLIMAPALLLSAAGLGYGWAIWLSGAGGLCAAVFLSAPMRLSGAAGLSAFASARFRSPGLGAFTALVGAFIGLGVVWVATPLAISGLAQVPGLSPFTARALVSLLVMAMVIPGGQASLGATAVILVVIVIAVAVLPVMLVLPAVPFSGLQLLEDVLGTLPGLSMLAESSMLLVLAVAGLNAFSGHAFSMRDASLARRIPEAAVLLALVLTALGMLGAATALRVAGLAIPAGMLGPLGPSAPGVVQLDLPATLLALLALAVPLLAAGMVAICLRFGWAGLVDDAIYGLFRWHGTASGRLALQRFGAGLTLIVMVWTERPALPAEAVSVLLALAAGWPLAVILPALSRTADWRIPALLGGGLLIAASVLASGAWQPDWWLLLAMFSGAMAALLMGLRSSSPEEARLADVVAGRLPGPLHQEADA